MRPSAFKAVPSQSAVSASRCYIFIHFHHMQQQPVISYAHTLPCFSALLLQIRPSPHSSLADPHSTFFARTITAPSLYSVMSVNHLTTCSLSRCKESMAPLPAQSQPLRVQASTTSTSIQATFGNLHTLYARACCLVPRTAVASPDYIHQISTGPS